ncbi:hypothetical protein CP97_03310 [Aurantiacibacter atlanticus]|uniref:Uncharacterized protein n=1 Tax=Aurantiacibacter atlanticus TaxID=1648404 RepID=A0A0H4VEM6_9SPHN|nr:hypothetical protein [Aurantiacibacter atlanticus]AKQ41276.1 hypothetical protein CP97_03310 [Aurantiacibacter atlanticus]
MGPVPTNPGTRWLLLAGWLTVAASALHIGCIIGGEEWYRFFGAGEAIANAAARGEFWPHVVTFGIAAIVAVWALYAFSGASRIGRLPLLRTALILISLIYLVRGLLLFPLLIISPDKVNTFSVWSSLIVLAYGVAYAIGAARAWRTMSQP